MNMSGEQVQEGLRADEFVPFFQPIVTLHTGKVAGVEVLARWQHKRLGIVAPGAFIATAEQAGLISELTAVLMAKAFAAARVLLHPQWLAVNISPHLLRDAELPTRIVEAAAAAAFPLNRLVIEITESALVDNLELGQSIARELKSHGCRLALDDFGTGYSSLLHLQSLPFDELKVDRSFVGSMTERRECRKIVSAVVGLGQSLALGTIAEGVETEEQAEMLLALGCDMGQGWLFGRPVPAEQLFEVVQPRRPVTLRLTSDFWTNISYRSPPVQRLAHLQALYDGALVGLAFLSPELRYVSINKHLAEMNSAPVHQHLGKHVNEVIPAGYPLLEPHLRRALAGNPVSAVEIEVPATEMGNGQMFLVSYLPAFDEAGEVMGISVSVVDVTSLKQTEVALGESEDHYRHMVEMNPQIPWVLDDKGMATMISPRWQQITGMTEEEYRGRGFISALHPTDQKLVQETIEHSLYTGDPIDVECRVRTYSGAWCWIRSRGAPRRDETGKIIRWYGSADIIDAQKRLEEELRGRAGEESARL